MEDGDDDTSLTTDLKLNSEDSVVSEDIESKELFSGEEDLTSPNVSKEAILCSETEQSEGGKEDICDQSSKTKTDSDTIFDSNLSVYLEDQNCDKTVKFSEARFECASESCVSSVSKPDVAITCFKDSSESFKEPCEVLCSKDEANVVTSLDGGNIVFPSLAEEEKESSVTDEYEHVSCNVQNTDEVLDTSHESVENCDSSEERSHCEFLEKSNSVNTDEGDSSAEGEINLSDSACNSEVHNISSSPKDKEISETLDTSSLVNDSFQNDTTSTSSSISQSCINLSLSQENDEPIIEEATKMEVTHDNELYDLEQTSLEEPSAVKEVTEQQDWESPQTEQQKEELQEQKYDSEQHIKPDLEEMETSESINGDDNDNCPSNISDFDSEIKHDSDVEMSEVQNEWLENETDKEASGRVSDVEVVENDTSKNAQNEIYEVEKEESADDRKETSSVEKVMIEDTEEMFEETEKEMSIEEEEETSDIVGKEMKKDIISKEKTSDGDNCDESQENDKNNTHHSVMSSAEHGGDGVCVEQNILSAPSPGIVSSKESKGAKSEDQDECDKQSQSKNKAVKDNSVKINGEVDLEQRDSDEEDSCTCIREKVVLKRKLQSSPTEEIPSESAENDSCKLNVCFKGLKKRYIAHISEVTTKQVDESQTVGEEIKLRSKRSIKKLVMEPTQVIVSHQQLADRVQSDTPLTEYAQYLGLQPTVKFKCYNCGESGFPSMLKLQEHQNTCLKNVIIQTLNKPPPSPIVEPVPSTNFRITRKVYLCSACGTYYENWNLFLHMREVHKRHICLFCLLMFSQADKLALHLSTKHGIADDEYNSPEEFLNEYDSSFFVMCCTCEQMFTERDNFFDHTCGNVVEPSNDQACSLCGLRGAHFPTCRRAFTDSSAVTSPSHNVQSNVINTESPSSQSTVQDKVSKYSSSTEKSGGRKSHQKQSDKNNSGQNRNPECDDDYDISDAASYCHVNIDEPDRQKTLNLNSSNSSNEVNSSSQTDTKQMPDSSDENDKQNVSTISTEISKDMTKEKNVTNEERENAYCNSPYEIVTLDEKESTQFSANNEPVHNDIPEKEHVESPSSIIPEPVVFPESQNVETVDEKMETPAFNSSKPPKEGDTESDSSASAAESHGSDDSSSGSDASSDEIEAESKEPPQVAKAVVSEESDLDKSDSDKMSIVVDDARSDDEEDKQEIMNDITANENEVEDTDDSKNNLEIDTKMAGDKCVANNNDSSEEQQDNIQVAGEDVPLLELTLEETMDMMPIQALVKECVKISCSTCVYCNHAKKIAVNGKQLVLHLLAEHRFEPVVCSDSGELIPVNGFIDNLKGKLIELQDMYFNTDSYDSNDKSFTKPYDRTYECFHCHFITTLHKELYVHNRKMHQKTILLCIMCKSNFYSYSELLCHLCPGIYVPDSNISFRCCLCVVDGLPSAFRLMVHLRKRHHACDVCLETTGDQQKLSNHVWKHKLHHLCYRCGIAYRNKPDITKHLFWKHGTESVLCKKCLQKKWPHVYHFCIPPTAFLCEECNASFTRAVALKVHKRLHVGDIAYECDECQEKFISKKLLRRHKDKHKLDVESENQNLEQIKESKICDLEPDNTNINNDSIDMSRVDVDVGSKEDEEILPENTSHMGNSSKGSEASDEVHNQTSENTITKTSEETKCKKSKVVDVYDLPPLNLSSESDDSEDESVNKKLPEETETKEEVNILSNTATEIIPPRISQEGESQLEEEAQPVEIVDGVWDNFKNYKANLEKREILQAQVSGSLITNETVTSLPSSSVDCHAMMDIILADHDYCIVPEKPKEKDPESLTHDESLKKTTTTGLGDSENPDDKGDTFGADHNYCYNTSPGPEERKENSECALQTSGPLAPQSPPLQLTNQNHPVSISTPNSSPKKKQKSPKKKQRQSGSSSSSDSSSNSDSSSCTCGTNCSCSSSSSSSSGSSSSSSDSDSSSSEGRRRQAIRRERRRERAKRKLDSESRGGTPPATAFAVPSAVSEGNHSVAVTPMQIDSGGGVLQVDDGPPAVVAEPEENEFLIRESDLDTTETETDEDFYDKYPQRQANKLLAEKRNQLLLLAAVAPVNNGTLTQPNSPPPAPVEESTEPVQKKKGRNKRHKKAQHSMSEKKLENKLKLNIPITYYNNPSFSASNSIHPVSPVINSQNVAPSHVSRIHEAFSPVPEASSTPSAYHSTGSGSETESKRLSKRKRIPKKFYGDSSDEEAEHTPHLPYKWRKVIPNNNSNPPAPPAPPPPSASSQSVSSMFSFRSVNVPAPEQVHLMPPQTKSDDGDDSESGQEAKRSSSDSSNSDSDNEHSDGDSDVETVASVTNTLSSVSGNVNQQKNENLYCYCQCPYDEVSEMIACDGKDCSIEWFHFECVGIMVPPKGKWFCPDCRKKTAARSEYLLHA